MNKAEVITTVLNNFPSDRPVMRENNTLEKLNQYLEQEVDEYLEDGITVKDQMTELADVIIYAATIITKLGGDPFDEVIEKIAFNLIQHPSANYQQGDYNEQRKTSKDWCRERGTRDEFYRDF